MQPEFTDRFDVLFLLGPVQLRGSSNRAMTLIERLIDAKIGLKLVTTETLRVPPKARSKIELRTAHHLNRFPLRYLSRRFLASDLRKTPPALIDIQHRSLHAVGSWLARKLRCPYIVTFHDYLHDREKFLIDKDWCFRVVAVSDSVRNELLQRTQLREEQVTVIPSGVLPPAESDLQVVLGDEHVPVIGTAGPLEAGKGLKHFLKAAALVLQEYPNAMFLIAGSGPEERSLRRLAKEIGVAHALTILPNLLDFEPALRAMDIFVLPALKQGLGSIMLDAMARGLPVIATESGGVYSVVLDGTTGLLVPPADELALAERIKFLLAHPQRAHALGTAARQRVVEHFHLERMITSTISLYREAAATRRSRQ